MKELSIEEKARAYDKALERAQALYNDKNEIGYANAESVLEEVFPLLKESDDERIRKRIIALVNAHGQGIYKGDMLAWLENIPYTIDREKRKGFHLGYKAGLEKQGESSDQIHYWTEEEIEPIISDYLRGAEHYGGMIGRLRCLKPKPLEKQGDSPIKWNKNTEGNKPQVNHSVLMKTTHGIAEGEWKGEYWEQYRWAGIVRDSDVLSWIEFSDLEKQGEQTINQPDFEIPFGAKDSELIEESYYIPKGFHAEIIKDRVTIKKGEQKPAWSVEDTFKVQRICKYLCEAKKYYADITEVRDCIEWLKSLKQRIGG